MARCLATASMFMVLQCGALTKFHPQQGFLLRVAFAPTLSPACLRTLRPQQLNLKIATTSTRRSFSVIRAEAGAFLADSGVTWKSLGVSTEVADALVRAELPQPSLVQAAAIPLILGSGDVVVAAETGSGKTHAYLTPLVQKLYKPLTEDVDVDDRVRVEDEGTPAAVGERLGRKVEEFGLVLCPNALLCQQVADMANALQTRDGAPMLRVVVISGGQGWPSHPPDLMIATPAALVNNLYAYDASRRRRTAFVRGVKVVVLDEADMLLGGGFVRQVGRLIDLFRLEEKRLFRSLQMASAESVKLESGLGAWTEAEKEDDVPEENEEVDEEDTLVDEANNSILFEQRVAPLSGLNASMQRRTDFLRSQREYKRSKQYIFVAATVPQAGKSSPGAVLKQKFPAASWVHGNNLHRHNPTLEHRWLEVTQEEMLPALIEALKDGDVNGRTLVFANSIESVDAIARVLDRAGFKSMRYHRDLSFEERAEALQLFEQEGGLLICTDSAARGLDIPNITHVIQAEFATSAVDFLHRIGRTARAGQPGLVTSLFTDANLELVGAMRDAVTAALPVEGAFSRKRSLRRKIKKYGSYQESQNAQKARSMINQ